MLNLQDCKLKFMKGLILEYLRKKNMSHENFVYTTKFFYQETAKTQLYHL